MSVTNVEDVQRAEPMKLANVEDIYPMSPMQQGLLFHCLYEPGSGMYLLEIGGHIEAGLNVPAFRRAWEEVIRRHAVLRTAFLWEGLSKPMQVVRKNVELPWREEDWRDLSDSEQKERWKNFLLENRKQEFDFKQAPLIRLALMRTGEQSYYFAWTGHHIVADGWCWQIVMGEALTLYDAYREGRTVQLKQPRLYRDYISWLQKQDESKAEAYWRETLQGFSKPTRLGMERDGELKEGENDHGVVQSHLNWAVSEKLEELARDQMVTLSTVVQAAWAVVLSRYSGEKDVAFGATVSGRSGDPGFEETVGLFINTLPVRVQVDEEERISAYLQRLQQLNATALDFEYSPLLKVQEWSDVLRGMPLFENIVVFENYPVDAAIQKGAGSSLKFSEISTVESNSYPLALVVRPGTELSLICHHNCRWFDEASVERLMGHLMSVLQAIAKNPDQRVGELSLLTPEEREQVVVEWNRTGEEYPARCVHELMEEEAARRPGAVALEIGGRQISYGELNERANQVAHYLRKKGVGPEVRVGVSVGRSLELVVGLLGVLKAGGAYVPLDPEHPVERLRFMMEDAGVEVLLTEERLLGEMAEGEEDKIAEQRRDNPERRNTLENLAYVLYTSGSTGKPKGVGIEHRSLMNYIWWARQAYEMEGGRGFDFALYSSISFDLTVTSIFTPLITGGCIHIYESEHEKENLIERVIEEDKAETVKLTPSHLSMLGPIRNRRLRQLIVGGEALESQLARRVVEQASGPLVIWNEYGPTEATVACVLHRYGAEDEGRAQVLIGKAGANAQIYILDQRQEPVAVGITGEIYIGGAGLARGYVNRPELTAERFVPDPFSEAGGKRLYRTGDRGRYQEGGNIEYLGRQDEQVKYHGYRVELNEIRIAINQFPGIRDSVVVVEREESGQEVMVAYYVSRQEQKVGQLRAFLEESLIQETVPNFFVHLAKMPLTLNGKVNYKALPGVKEIRKKVVSGLSQVEPRTPTEEMVAGIWSQVLQMEKVGVEDNFFELGGHSLLATQVMSRVRSVLGVELPLRGIFESPTVRGLAQAIERQRQQGKGVEMLPIGRADRTAALPLSFAQQRLWFIDQLEPGSSAYNMPFGLKLTGRVDRVALQASVREIVMRHEVLRTSFPADQGIAVQRIASDPEFGWEYLDLKEVREKDRVIEIQNLVRNEADAPFDLAHGPLLRVKLLQLTEQEHVLLVTMHHIVSDGWSMNVMAQELAKVYESLRAGVPPSLPELEIQYADYAVWQREWLQGEMLELQLEYWKKQLADAPELELATDFRRSALGSQAGRVLEWTLTPQLSQHLKELSKKEGVTVFMTLMACWQLLLSRYTGQEDVTVGTPVMGRRMSETEGLIGFFVNTLVLRTRLSRDTSFRQLLKQVRETTLDAYAHQDIPFEKLVEELQPKRQLNRTPFFQVMFSWMNAPKMELELPGLKLEQMSSELETSKFEIVVAATESGEKIQGAVSYRTALYKERTIRRMMDRFERLLAEIVQDADRAVDDIPLLNMDERRQLLVEWNQTQADYPQLAVQQLFEQQAGRNPEAIAIVSESARINYGELNRRANQLAAYLRKLGVGPEERVGICAERSPEMVVGLLAILKAGGAYVPLDPEYPSARLASMLEDSGLELVLSQHKFLEQLSFHPGRTIVLDQDWKESESQHEENPLAANTIQSLAYVMYTSGSTGRPKGTMITHEAIVRLVMNTDYVQVEPSDRMAHISNPSFDAATFEIWGALLNGASLVVIPKEIAISPLALARRLEAENVSVMFLTTALFNHVAREAPGALRGLRSVLFGGEMADPQWPRKILGEAPPRSLLHVYGPTEATTFSTWFELKEAEGETLPIGRPLKNTTTYVLRNAHELAPVGTVGELCIGGPGLARGYVNQPELTAERFVPNPYSEQPGSRLYRTGDLVKQAEDGSFEFVGRRDQQIKLRGHRIELSEIEAVLNRHEAVDESCVLLWGEASDDKRIVAYVVAKAGSGELHLREYLRERLPDYSVPGSFMFLETLPLTLNGKIDRMALPTPESARDGSGLVHARTPVEETLTGIWCEVLKLQSVSVEDNFFDLGGHSLLATQLMSRIRQECAMELPLRLLFESPTIAGLAAHIEQQRQEGTSSQTSLIQRVERKGSLPLSFAQQRLWFIDQLEPGSAAYNVPFGLKLVGSVDSDAVKRSVQEIVKRHEVLRTTFAAEEGVAVQKIESAPVFGWEEIDLIPLGEAEGEAEARRIARLEAGTPFDLARGPLLRMKLLHLPGNEHVLLVNMHHIVSDGWSVGIMVREFAQFYGAWVEGQEISLPELPIQYADFAVWQREWLQGEVLEKQLRYWKKQLSEVLPLELNTDRPRSLVESHRGERIQLEIGQELTTQLNEVGRREGATLFMTLLASLQVVLSRYTGQTDITIGTDIANRNRVETEGLIGFFVNELVMRTDLSGDPSLRELLSRVKQTALQAYENQDVPFEKLVEELQPERDLGRAPFFQISLVLQNTPEKRLRLPGVEAGPFDPGDTRPKLDLELVFAEDPEEGLKGSITYATDLFDRSTIERFAGHLARVLKALAVDAGQRISEVNLLSAEEQMELLVERHQTRAELPRRCVQELFEQQVERTPEAIAVECDGTRVSYRELNARANQLAGYLRDHQVLPEVRVGVFMRRSVELLVGFLGILKAGGVYVSLDPDYPAERLSYMVDDANVALLLTFEEILPFEAPETPMVSLREWELMARQSTENPELLNHMESLAYVMYTSGSTGKPKGVMIEQRGMVNHLCAKISGLNLTAADVIAQNASSSFDISVWQFLAALLVGGRVAIIGDDAARDPWKTLVQTQELGVTVLETVPTMLAVMLAEQERAGSGALPLHGLRCLISNAEALPGSMCGEWQQLHPHVQLFNTYGATECSDDTCHCCISESLPEDMAYAPLGSPIAHTTIHVLDQWQQLVPMGVAGEIYIGGICLGRGYLDQPAITAEKFVPNPFGVSGERLYRTGDRGRWCSDGSLQFTGRADHQLKIRGHRIELGEIEAALNEHPGVEQAVVVPVDDTFGGKELLGCMVLLRGAGNFEIKDIRSHLAQQLPDYMVPATLLELPEFPLTPSGKVDRKALAALRVKTGDQTHEISRNLEEDILSGIFSEVLGRTRVGTRESFFELGGHSLLATQIVSRIRTVFKVELPLRALFESPTVAGLAVQVRAARGVSAANMVQIPRAAREDRLPLSFAQQRLWVLDKLEPGSVAYNIPFGVRLQGTLDKRVLRWSLEEIVRRHEILRTTFPVVDGEPAQRIAQEFTLAIEETDLTELAGQAQEEEVTLRAQAEAAEPFNLAQGPLVRLKLLQLSEQEHVLLVNMHHIVSDGWSAGVIMQEFTRLYEAGVKGEGSPLPELPIQYADFALWQRDWLQGPVLQSHLQYWTRQLAQSPVLELPTDRPRPALPSRRGARIEVEFPRELKTALENLSRRFGTTLYMTLLTAFQVLLGRYSGQTDVVVGVPIAGRTYTEIEPLIGMFFNVLALRTDLSGNPTVQELLGRVRETALEGYAHQELPFERLVAELELERNLSYSPLFQIIFEMNNTPQDTRELPGLRIEKMWTEYGVAKVDLTLSMFDSPSALSGAVQFSTDLFDASTIERLMRHYVTLLERMAGDAGQRLSELGMLTEGERSQVVGEWNRTAEDLGEGRCLHELFEEQAERTPEEAAVVWEGKGMSYGELEKRSNQLGHYLRKQGVGPEVRVGLCVGRSPEMVVGLLGILKAGGAYVALDGSYPKERVAFMVEDSKVSVVLTEAKLLEKLPGAEEQGREGKGDGAAAGREEAQGRRGPKVVCLDQEWEKIAGERESRPESGVSAENMAYIYYTSGSTGRPKGVVMAHAGIVNYIRWGVEAYEARAGKGAAVHSSIAVDLTLTNFLPLFVGKAMVLVEEKPGVEGLVKLLRQKPGWSLLKLTPTHLTLLNAQLTAEEKRASTRVLVIGADNLVAEPTLAWRKEAPGVKLLNEYGPTETVVGCSIYRIGEGSPRQGGMPIGKPIANMTMYVLDGYGQPLPVGVPGELYIGGVGVARGYWGRPELTAEKFVPDGLGGEAGARFYRTGDRARFLEDGNIEFLGRLDHQVKIRGYRVEPGEVEAVLSGCPGVQKAMVVVREDVPGDKRLVGYVAAPGGGVEVRELRQYLKERLPEYMVPVAWVIMEELPVRGSGKIDPKDLPRPEMEGSQGKDKEEGPRTEVERVLAGIWGEVLGVKQVGIHDNFFELGGDSILSIQVITRAREAGLGLQPRQMFERQTIAELAEVVGSESEQVEAEQGVVNGEVELTPIQSAFFEWGLVKPEHYNQSVLLEVGREVDTEVLEEVMMGLLDQHDALRMRYEEREGEGWRQWCEAEVLETVYERKDLSWIEDEAEQRAALERDAGEAQGSLDIRTGRVVKVVEYELGEERGRRLLLTVHHLVMDGVSWRILLEDLERGYGQRQAGEELSLGMKTTSYQQWAEKLRKYGKSDAVRQEMEYWAGEERRRAGRLPRDIEAAGEAGEAANLFGTQSGVTVWLEEEETRKLLQDVPGVYQTQINDVLLTALGRVCGEWSGSQAVLVDLEGHGREDIFAEVDHSRTVGWFTAMYPVLLEVGEAGQWEPGRALSGTKEQLRGVPQRGIGYGLLRYGRGTGNEDISQRLKEMPQAEISFNYLGQIDQILQGSKLFRPGRERIGSESAAENPRQHVLAVSGIVVQGRLQLDWNYSGKLHRRETIEALADRYLDCLRELIAHCLSPDAGGFTPSDFPLTKLTQTEIDQWIRKQDGIEDAYPLSAAQQGMLFHSLFESGTQTYFVQLSCHFAQLNVQAFQRAWNEVIQRHGILRTGFIWEGLEEPLQVVRRTVEHPWHELDARNLDQAQQEAKWQRYLIEDRQRGFDLQKAPLLRLTLMRTTENGYYFAWSTHHILLDAWCREILIKEVFTFYEAYQQGLPPQLKRPPIYRDYIAWLQKQDEKAIETFWRKELKGITTATRLGIERKGTQKDEGQETVEVILPAGKELTEKLESLARKHQFTLNTLVQGAWGLLLSHYSGDRDVIFGMPVSGRSAAIPGIEEIAGPFINTLPVRVHVAWEETLGRYLQRLQMRQAEVRDFEHSSLLKVQGWSEIPHGTPLFENIVVFENYPADTALQLKVGADMNISASTGFMSNHYPLTLTVIPRGELSFMATYERQSFEPGSIERILGQLRTVLENMASGLEQKLGDVSLSTQAELCRAVTEWNQTQAPSSSMTVHELFEEQAAKTPQAIAVTCQGVQLTYRELDQRANQLAHYLRNMGIGPEMRVGLCLERSHELVVALLGVLKSGAAYIPLDPSYPPERLAFMVQDAEIPVLLTSSKLRNAFPTVWVQLLCIDADWPDISSFPGDKPEACADGDNLAYMIYTSGSTGQPKGVAVTHRGLANYLQWAIPAYDFQPDVVSPLHSSLSFDLTVTSIYPALLTGGHVEVMPQNAGVTEIAGYLRSGRPCLLKLTPGHLQVLNDLLEKDTSAASNAKALVIGGETLKYADLKFWQLAAPDTRLINEYGPTETVVGCCVYEVERSENARGAVPIGRPITNMRMFVLDDMLQPAPVGVKGEIYIGGEGVARGYWRRPDLTAERFVPDPFSETGGGRLYRAGDLARYRDDGNIEYLGRTDHQIKLRGYRIELGEIESILAGHQAVRQSAVIVREDDQDDQRLVGYVVLHEGNEKPTPDELKDYLRTKLPEYMVPSSLILLEQLPLTANGKLDGKALPKPGVAVSVAEMAPYDDVAMQLEIIWQEVLKVSSVGRRQTFFELGGHSLLAIRLIKRIQEQFGQELPISAVFEAATIEQMSNLLRGNYRPKDRSNLVPLHPHGSRRPLFFVHPGGGGVGGYRDLAQLLGDDQPFYGLQALDDEENKDESILSIEQRAARYIEAIQTVDAHGPYILGGWSMGGFIAYEMAQQLKRQGREIAGLILVDIVAQTQSDLPSYGDDAEELLEVTREMGTATFSLDSVKDKGHDERLSYLLGQLIEAKVLAPEITVPMVRSFLKGLRRRNQSMIDYQLAPYNGPVTLIRAEKGRTTIPAEINSADPTLGFSSLCSKVDVAFVPGTHYDLMFPPHVESLAEAVRRSLQDFDLCQAEAGLQTGYVAV